MKKRLIPLFASVALLAAGASSCGFKYWFRMDLGKRN